MAKKPAKKPAAAPPADPIEPGAPRIERVPIDSVRPDPANAKTHGQRSLDAIKSSLNQFGQQKPIVVDGESIVRAGNGTWTAAKALGWMSIDIIRSTLTAAQLRAFALADNRTAELSGWDEQQLSQQLAQLELDGIAAADIGFDPDEVEKFLKVTDGPAADPPAEEPKPAPREPATPDKFMVLITCSDELQQTSLLERFAAEGLQVKALNS